VHRHPWGEADVLLWDNRQLLHMASTVPPGEPSVSFRIGVYDGLPFYVGDAPSTLLGPEVECR
jgi:taurine dioxygenase